ncbi:MAG: hypothetical protein JXN65_11920 [Clostridia bacterium]|nr:hypothetical protein [Clostridia bacterium]
MIRLTILIGIIIILILAEVLLSTRKNKWLGLIIPAVMFILLSVFLIFNLLEAFLKIEDLGRFLLLYGRKGVFALILKMGFVYSPVILNLIIYFVIRKIKYPKDSKKEINKMLADDL